MQVGQWLHGAGGATCCSPCVAVAALMLLSHTLAPTAAAHVPAVDVHVQRLHEENAM